MNKKILSYALAAALMLCKQYQNMRRSKSDVLALNL